MLAGTARTSNEAQKQWHERADTLADEIFASMPFHLTCLSDLEPNSRGEFNERKVNSSLNEKGRTVGGLLLIHPLYVVLQMSSVSDTRRNYARYIMKWIGNEMGIGEALVLSDVSLSPPNQY